MISRNFPDWLQAYMDYTYHSEGTDSFHFWTGVATIAGALRRKVYIDFRRWQLAPNFYIIFVGPAAAVNKSTTMNMGMDLLRGVEGIYFGPKIITWQRLIQRLAKAQDKIDLPDGTSFTTSCLTVAASEFGSFLDPQNREQVDALTDLWGGDNRRSEFDKETKTQGSDKAANPWLNIIACTTPTWLRKNFPDAAVGTGLASRCIWIYGDAKRKLVSYPQRLVTSEEDKKKEMQLIMDLKQMALMVGPMDLTEEAFEYGDTLYTKYNKEIPTQLNNERFGGYIGRKQAHLHKLAMVLSAARTNSMTITQPILETADALLTALEADMPKVFASIGQSENVQQVVELIQIVRAGGEVSRKTLWRNMVFRMGEQEFETALNAAVSAKYLKQRVVGADILYKAIEEPVTPKR